MWAESVGIRDRRRLATIASITVERALPVLSDHQVVEELHLAVIAGSVNGGTLLRNRIVSDRIIHQRWTSAAAWNQKVNSGTLVRAVIINQVPSGSREIGRAQV